MRNGLDSKAEVGTRTRLERFELGLVSQTLMRNRTPGVTRCRSWRDGSPLFCSTYATEATPNASGADSAMTRETEMRIAMREAGRLNPSRRRTFRAIYQLRQLVRRLEPWPAVRGFSQFAGGLQLISSVGLLVSCLSKAASPLRTAHWAWRQQRRADARVETVSDTDLGQLPFRHESATLFPQALATCMGRA